jgi:hypothetical protein
MAILIDVVTCRSSPVPSARSLMPPTRTAWAYRTLRTARPSADPGTYRLHTVHCVAVELSLRGARIRWNQRRGREGEAVAVVVSSRIAGHGTGCQVRRGSADAWLPLAIAFCLALLIALANPVVQLSSSDWIRGALLFALSCGFLGQIYGLARAPSPPAVDLRSGVTASGSRGGVVDVELLLWLPTGRGDRWGAGG